ncbi:MAG: thiamine pyrophosphate-binding protein [Proteobacteria bacterium]|nr:thiamine pyrophosphate-binding protein [Pseudomonadota bacterium]
MPKVSEVIVQSLKAKGVTTIFGIPSIHNVAFYEALRQEPSIGHILCRHEASATHMADGYARSGRGIGVVVASTGPGVTYTLSPLLEAWCSCSPVLLITSYISTDTIGRGKGVLHEMDNQDAPFRDITKATICLRSTDDVGSTVERAVKTAVSGRPGPVYLEVPENLWEQEATVGDPPAPEIQALDQALPDLKATVDRLRQAELPIIIAGREAQQAGLGLAIAKIAESLQAPILTDYSGKGIVPEDHPLAFGSALRRGAVRELRKTCDVTLSVGSRLRNNDFHRRKVAMPGLIHIDWDDTWVDKNYKADIPLIGDVPAIAASLADRLGAESPPASRRKRVEELRSCLEQERSDGRDGNEEARYIDAIRRAMPRDGRLVVDSTILAYLAEQLYPSYVSGGVVPPRGATPIGFGFPAAVGVKLADPSKPVAALVGDGGFLYGAQELATCIRHGIAFPVIVVNDDSYRMIDYLQLAMFQEGYETSLSNPDFVAFAESFGVSAVRVDSPEELGQALEKSLVSGKMELIEVKTAFPNPPFLKY